MPIEYHKLVRDRIPEIIRQDGRECATEIMAEEEHRQALLEKLLEEAQEAAAVGLEKLVEELADLYEVIDALLAAYGIKREAVMAKQVRKRAERGGWAEEPAVVGGRIRDYYN
jgi:predicted house-cleaning noncanonical NTP pyrophosphatase (MazG superfamily)